MNTRSSALCILVWAIGIFSCPPTWSLQDESDPTDAEDEGKLFLESGAYDLAREVYTERLDAAPDDLASRLALADILGIQGEYDAAIGLVSAAPEPVTFAKSAPLQVVAGRMYLATGRLAEAQAAFGAALAIDPANVAALNRLGEVFSRQGRTAEAEARWNRVVAVYQDWSVEEAERAPATDYVEMGIALRSLNRFHDANEIMFPQAREQDEHCLPLFVEWARTYMEKYDYPFCRTLLREALDQNSNYPDAHVLYAENCLEDFQIGTNRYELAETHIGRALEVNPKHAGAMLARGRIWLSDGDFGRAASDFEAALAVDPSNLTALGFLAAAHHLFGGREEVVAALERRALGVNPRGARYFHTFAQAIEQRFRYQEARAACERAIELDPDYWPAFYTLGINCLRTGHEEKGRQYLQQSYDKDPFNVWVVNTRKLLRYLDANHKIHESEHFICRLPKEDYSVLVAFLVPLLEDAYTKLSAHYGVELTPPIHVDVFSKHQWFSARIAGLGGFPATGACFGNVVALTTPKALPQNWGAVAWHEFAHTVTLAKTNNQVPRWLTEGLSVFEEGRDYPWKRSFEREIADSFGAGRLLSIGELDFGFSKPKYPNQILISYYQGCLVVEYIREVWGFEKIQGLLDGYRDKKSLQTIFREVLDTSLEDFDRGFFAWLARWVEATGYQPSLSPDAVQSLELEAETKPDDLALLAKLAWGYFSVGNPIDAELTCFKVLDKEPGHADALAVLGFVRVDQKKSAAAKESFEAALEGRTRFAFRVHSALGQLALQDDDRKAAIEHFEMARETSPRAGAGAGGPGNLYYRLVDLHRKEGNEERAIELLEAQREIGVEDAKCRLDLAQHYLALRTDEGDRKAFEILREVIFINPFDPELHKNLARLAERLGEHETTIQVWRLLLEQPDTNPRKAYLALARAHLGLGQKVEARGYAEKVLEIDEENEDARAILETIRGG